MSVAPSFADIRAQVEAELLDQRPDLSVNDGDVTDAMLDAAAVGADQAIRYAAQAFRDTFIDGAKGDALTTLVDDHLNIQRQAATKATTRVRFHRASTTAGGGTIAAGTQVGTAFGPDGRQIVFVTDADVTVGATDVDAFVNATAQDAGRGSNTANGKVTEVISALYDTFTVTSIQPGAGGNDQESDESLRQRAKTFFLTLRRGTLAALEYGARQVPEVRFAKAFEDPETFAVQVRISDSDGAANIQMQNDVEIELENWRCAGVYVKVVPGVRKLVSMNISIKAATGFDLAAYSQLIIDSVTARIDKLKPGETLYFDPLIAAIVAVSPDEIYDVTFSGVTIGGAAVAAGDYVPPPSWTLRADTITVI